MKKISFFSSMLLSLFSFASSENINYKKEDAKLCVNHGVINDVWYTPDNILHLHFFTDRPYVLYTDRMALFPLLFSAYMNRTIVDVYTNSCSHDGGFAEVTFYGKSSS